MPEVLGQRAQHVAGADLLLAAAQRSAASPSAGAAVSHRLRGWPSAPSQRMPHPLPALHLVDAAHAAHLVQAGKVEHLAGFTRPAGAAHAVRVHLGTSGVMSTLITASSFTMSRPRAATSVATSTLQLRFAKLHQHLIALALFKVAMQLQGHDALRLQHGHQVAALLAWCCRRPACSRGGSGPAAGPQRAGAGRSRSPRTSAGRICRRDGMALGQLDGPADRVQVALPPGAPHCPGRWRRTEQRLPLRRGRAAAARWRRCRRRSPCPACGRLRPAPGCSGPSEHQRVHAPR
jgi:hypothetical protein